MRYRIVLNITSQSSQSSQTVLQGIVERDVYVTLCDIIHFCTRLRNEKRHEVTKKSRFNSLLERELRRL